MVCTKIGQKASKEGSDHGSSQYEPMEDSELCLTLSSWNILGENHLRSASISYWLVEWYNLACVQAIELIRWPPTGAKQGECREL